MDSTRPANDLSSASTAAPQPSVLNHQKGASGKSSMSAVGVYQQRAPARGLPRTLLVGLIAAVLVLAFLIGRILF